MVSTAVIVVIALGLATFPSPTGAVSAAIQRDARPDRSTIGRATTTANRSARLALPATMALAGSDAQIRVIPLASSDGVAQRPTDPSMVSWWMTGQRPGAPGRAFHTGRFAWAAGGGARPGFDRLEKGDPIKLTGADGNIHHFRVTERRQFSQTELETSLLTDTRSNLLLISCAGRLSTAGPDDTHLLITAGEVDG